jgi:hypothetical protein
VPATGFALRAQRLASRLVPKFGATVTLTRTVPGTFDPATNTRTASADQAVAVKAVETPYAPLLGVGMGQSYQPDSAQIVDGRSFILAGADVPFAPAPGMTITNAVGVRYTIVTVKIDAPTGEPVAYTCACSKG